MRLANQLKCGMSTNPISSFVLCVWKFANLPPSTQQETDRKSVQLFIVFLPVLPQETVHAANGAQQRLHSLVRIRDTHVVRPLTHLHTAIANTAVLPFTLKWSSVPQPCISFKAWYHSIGPVDGSRETFADALRYAWTAKLLKKSSGLRRSLFMKGAFQPCAVMRVWIYECIHGNVCFLYL